MAELLLAAARGDNAGLTQDADGCMVRKYLQVGIIGSPRQRLIKLTCSDLGSKIRHAIGCTGWIVTPSFEFHSQRRTQTQSEDAMGTRMDFFLGSGTASWLWTLSPPTSIANSLPV